MPEHLLTYTCGHKLRSPEGCTETDCPACRKATTREYVEDKTADLQHLLREAQEERDREAGAVDRLENALVDANLDKDAATERAEAAEALAEKRNEALNASAPYLLGTGVPNAVLRRVGLARRITPAEAQEEGDGG